MTIIEAIILAIVEGLTEFLPVSSTGHMIITSSLMGIAQEPITKILTVNIQFGAILSVIVLYWRKFFQSVDFYIKLFIAFIPAAVLGFLLEKHIDRLLENVAVVAITLVLGGIVLIFIDKIFNSNTEGQEITNKKAFTIGLFQCIAMIPGVSRSAATIIGGMTQKLTKKEAAEFSFFLAVPTMFAATAYKLLKDHEHINSDNISILLIGNLVAFIVAMIAIKSFISIVTRYGFKVFGYYRIAVGLTIIIFLLLGFDLKII
jgi:undecaprenyl-diphosphatase